MNVVMNLVNGAPALSLGDYLLKMCIFFYYYHLDANYPLIMRFSRLILVFS